nr:MAG TPA_asm: hypothetical protein [Caudoviricetes sp.]
MVYHSLPLTVDRLTIKRKKKSVVCYATDFFIYLR